MVFFKKIILKQNLFFIALVIGLSFGDISKGVPSTIFSAISIAPITTAYASTVVGTISGTNNRAQFLDTAIVNKSINTGNFSNQSAYNVTVSDTELRGYMWSQQFGWIVLNCADTASGCSNANGNFKVANDGNGVLSGYAWGEKIGWINFAPTYGGSIFGVKIASDGTFGGKNGGAGYAWSQNYGWIVFDCSSSATCTSTEWQTPSARGATTQTPSSGGGSSNIAADIPNTPTAPDVTPDISPDPVPVVIPVAPVETPQPTPTDTPSDTSTPTLPSNPESSAAPSVGLPAILSVFSDNVSAGIVSAFTSFGDVFSGTPTRGDIKRQAEKGVQFIANFAPKTATFIAKNVNTKVVAPVAVGTSVAVPVVATAAMGAFSLADIGLVLLRLWSLLLTAIGIKRKHRPWGTVYDSVTKQPIDPAYVVLLDAQGKEVATSITDMDGRYGFAVPKGTYTLVASKTNYEFPSKKMVGKYEDELYKDLYEGAPVTVENDGDVIAKNIPMDALNFDWNEFEKNQKHSLKFYKRRDVIFARMSEVFFWIGLIVSVAGVLVYPTWYNALIFAMTIIVYALRVTGITVKPKGSVVQAVNDEPLPFSIVRVFSAATDREVLHKVADKTGQYYCLLQNGTYKVVIDKKNSDETYTKNPLPEVFTVEEGYLKKEFRV